ncbi:triphosphoribosyl-dephospho-CoA synthase [Limnobacter sp.]|uniref:triphosphoribosyl-dephospho-CoA synthase n=1 Tax=Limnobacter sp. TaxID=2003368 RepID=UPI0035144255
MNGPRMNGPRLEELALHIDHMACQALRDEVNLPLKPGLVCPQDPGSHADMTANTFLRSVHALRGYFHDCFVLGYQGETLHPLQQRGLLAERAMLAATEGVNTHKGAIFLLGLLAAAAGVQWARQGDINPMQLGGVVQTEWGAAIAVAGVQASTAPHLACSHGLKVKASHGLPGAREQAAQGFPVLFHITLPQLLWAHQQGAGPHQARLHALYSTMARLPDTNLAHRGGLDGLNWAQAQAEYFLARGGVFAHAWAVQAQAMCQRFKARWLSPGGCADLLSAALFVQRLGVVCHATHVQQHQDHHAILGEP